MIIQRYADFRGLFAGPGAAFDAAGYEIWPHSDVLYSPAVGFSLSLPSTLTTSATISVNALAPDAVNGTDEFDWFLSQRTEDVARQALTLVRSDGATTRSGTVALGPTALAATLYGITTGSPVPSPDHALPVFRDVWIYVRRRSDGAIMRGSFIEAANGP